MEYQLIHRTIKFSNKVHRKLAYTFFVWQVYLNDTNQ